MEIVFFREEVLSLQLACKHRPLLPKSLDLHIAEIPQYRVIFTSSVSVNVCIQVALAWNSRTNTELIKHTIGGHETH